MANPMRWFRRHQKLMMVVFGVGLMVVFGLGTVVSMVSPSDLTRGEQEDKVIAIWDDGEFKRSDLDNMRVLHFRTIEFLDALQAAAREQKGDEFRSAAMMISPIIRPGEDFQQELVDEELIRRALLAAKVYKDGLVVSDKMVNEYLAIVAGNARFSPNDHKAINRQVNMDRISMTNIREQLKMELAAQQMDLFSFAGFPFYPNPSEAIEINERMTREVDCQVHPIAVSDFEDKTGEPTEAELQVIYEQGKYNYPDPRGITPGFKRGKQVDIEYLVADFETFLQNEINELSKTPGKVKEFYDKMVEEENSLIMEIVPSTDPLDNSGGSDDDAAPKPRIKTGDESADSNDAPPVPRTQNKKADESAGSDDNPPAPPKKSDESKTEDKASDEKKDDGGQSLIVQPTTEQFVALQEEQKSEKTEDKSTENQKTTQDKTENAGEQKPGEQKSGDAAKQDDGDAAQEGETDEKPDQEKDNKSDSDESNIVQIPEIKDEPVIQRRPKPFKDVADQVKREMKRKDATDAVQRAMSIAEGEIRTYTSLYGSWDSMLETERGEKPVPPDMKKIADDNKLQHVKVGKVDEVEFSRDTLGKVIMFIPPRTTISISQFVFDRFDGLNLYDPINASDIMSGANYLYWVTEKNDATVPAFKEARADIVKFWKKQKAVELAMEEANKMAEQINSSNGRTLIELYPIKSVPTGGFKWFTTNFGSPEISNPTGVNGTSQEFMKTTFSLNVKQAGAAPNFLRDTVYVIQVTSDINKPEELGKEFLENQFFKFQGLPQDVQAVSQFYGRDLRQDWQTEFEKSVGLEFIGH